MTGVTLEEIQRIVKENNKQRFAIICERSSPEEEEILYIRANQGHSMQVRPGI